MFFAFWVFFFGGSRRRMRRMTEDLVLEFSSPLLKQEFRVESHRPGSSFGRKKVPDLNSAKFSAGFRKKRRRPEKTSGSKILKNRDDKRLDHTQGNCLCAASSSFGAHSNLPVPIALAHLPNGLRAEPSQNISNLCPSKYFQEETKEHVAMNSSFSATVSLKCFFTKWVALHDSYAS